MRKNLAASALSEPPRGAGEGFFSLLLALLHELDAEAFRRELVRLRSAPIHVLHRRAVEIMGRRHGDRVVGRLGGGAPIYIADEIPDAQTILAYLERWSATPGLDIARITRIDVIMRLPEMEYLGKYNLQFDGIVLTWEGGARNALARWWRKVMMEMTFYHEVGHHHFQHGEFGQVEDQEREADEYSKKMFRRAHPLATLAFRVGLFPIYFAVLAIRLWRSRRGAPDQ